jgi:hypothetical protein
MPGSSKEFLWENVLKTQGSKVCYPETMEENPDRTVLMAMKIKKLFSTSPKEEGWCWRCGSSGRAQA